ncbi:MAG: RNA polymerase sigma factor [Actinomycetota bacterium]
MSLMTVCGEGEGDHDRLSDEELVRSFLDGNQAALEELVERYQPTVMNLAYRMLGNRADAADVCQEVFLILLRKLHSFRGEAKFSTWLYRVAMNACHDHARRSRHHLSLADSPDDETPEMEQRLPDEGAESPESSMEREEIRRRVQEAIVRLPFKFRQVIYLHDISGYDYKEVADILGINLGTVKSRLNRARNRLAAELKDFWDQSR